MNFLSHFYFERNKPDNEQSLGALLPDLIRFGDKDLHLFPHKKTAEELNLDGREKAIHQGWLRHTETDLYFHDSAFFKNKTEDIKAHIRAVLHGSGIKLFFVTHIALELLLDRRLLIDNWVHEQDLYSRLEKADRTALHSFLEKSGAPEKSVKRIEEAIDDFIAQDYLGSYRNMGQLSFALLKISSSYWPKAFNEERKESLTASLTDYESDLEHNYKAIFDEISLHLQKKGL